MSTRQEKITAAAQALVGKWVKDDLVYISPGVWLYVPSDGRNQKITSITVATYYARSLIQIQEREEEEENSQVERTEHILDVQRRAEYDEADRRRRDRPASAAVSPPRRSLASTELLGQFAQVYTDEMLASLGQVTAAPPEQVPYPPMPQRIYPPWYSAEDIASCERLITRDEEIRSRPSRNYLIQSQFLSAREHPDSPPIPAGGSVEYDIRRDGWVVTSPVEPATPVVERGFAMQSDAAAAVPAPSLSYDERTQRWMDI